MKQAARKRWVAALRGGEYKQGKGRLLQFAGGEYRFCAMGVLCDLEVDDDWVTPDLHALGATYLLERSASCTRFPEPDRKRVGFIGYEPEDRVTEMNDGGASFLEIADWIEGNL